MKPKTSAQYRQSVAARTGHNFSGWRSSLPVLAILAMILLLAFSSLRHARGTSTLWLVTLFLNMFTLSGDRKPLPNAITVTSLEDRADFRFGRPFDELARSEQVELILEYQVGAFPLETAPFGRPLVPTDPRYPKRMKQRRILLRANLLFAVAAHAAYLHWPGLPLLRAIGSSRSLIFWLIPFLCSMPLAVLLWRGPQRSADSLPA